MRAYAIAMFLILFNMSVILVGALGFGQAAGGEASLDPLQDQIGDTTNEMGNVANWYDGGLVGLVSIGTGLFAGILSVIFRLPVGATVFAITFAVTGWMAGSNLNYMVDNQLMMSEVSLLLTTALAFVFLFAFIQLASSSTGD